MERVRYRFCIIILGITFARCLYRHIAILDNGQHTRIYRSHIATCRYGITDRQTGCRSRSRSIERHIIRSLQISCRRFPCDLLLMLIHVCRQIDIYRICQVMNQQRIFIQIHIIGEETHTHRSLTLIATLVSDSSTRFNRELIAMHQLYIQLVGNIRVVHRKGLLHSHTGFCLRCRKINSMRFLVLRVLQL